MSPRFWKVVPWLAMPATVLTGGVLQVWLYWYVMRKDRNHITQFGLGLGGLIPLGGARILAEQALIEAGYIEVPRDPNYRPPQPIPPVSTVTAYRQKVEESENR